MSILIGNYEAKTGGDAVAYLTKRFDISKFELAERMGVSKDTLYFISTGSCCVNR